ncbi:MAG: hypothetical protein ACFB4J_18290 [Elainellaceae cyanobacterium]
MYDPAVYLRRCLEQCLSITVNSRSRQQINFPLLKSLPFSPALVQLLLALQFRQSSVPFFCRSCQW